MKNIEYFLNIHAIVKMNLLKPECYFFKKLTFFENYESMAEMRLLTFLNSGSFQKYLISRTFLKNCGPFLKDGPFFKKWSFFRMWIFF